MSIKLAFLLFFVATIFCSLPLVNYRGLNQNQRIQSIRSSFPIAAEAAARSASAGGFTGFNDDFKNQMASLLAEVTKANTPQTIILKNKLMIGLISIDNTLTMISKSKQKEAELKPLLQYQVKNFLSDLDVVQEQLARLNGSTVIGNNNYAAGKVGYINGDNDSVFGYQNMVIGDNNVLKGNRSIISGNGNAVRGSNGVTVGTNNQVDADRAFVFSNNDVITQGNTLTVRDKTIDLRSLISGKGGYITSS